MHHSTTRHGFGRIMIILAALFAFAVWGDAQAGSKPHSQADSYAVPNHVELASCAALYSIISGSLDTAMKRGLPDHISIAAAMRESDMFYGRALAFTARIQQFMVMDQDTASDIFVQPALERLAFIHRDADSGFPFILWADKRIGARCEEIASHISTIPLS